MRNIPNTAWGAVRGLLLLGAALAWGLILADPAESSTLYVSPLGTDSSACGPQGTPCRNLDYAVNKALDGDTVRVAGGTYQFTNVGNACAVMPVKSVVCVIDKSITIRGGYASSTWNFDPVANTTVIDGQNTYRGVFVFSSGRPGVRLTMANVTVQNGRAKGTDAPSPYDPTAFGGGINVEVAAVTLDSVIFQSNQAVGADTGSGPAGAAAGSALSIRASSAVSLLSNVRFQSNSSLGGRGTQQGGVAFGALFVHASTVEVENSSFISNSSLAGASSGSGLINGERADALGAAVSAEGNAIVSLVRVSATGNQVVGGAGTPYGGGGFGGAVFAEDATVTIEDSLFQSNWARGAASRNGGFAAGGGILLFNSDGTIDRTRIIDNHVTGGDSSPGQVMGTGGGGGLYLWRSDPAVTLATMQVRNTVIADNTVELGQGTVNPGGGGGGLQVQGLYAHLAHVTFARNQLGIGLTAGQAMVVVPSDAGGGTADLEYSVVADHMASTSGAAALVVVTGNNTLNLNQGRFSGNTNNTTIFQGSTITGLASMLTIGSAGFVAPGLPNYDYHITAGSLLRGAATGSTTAVDMDYQPRADGLRDLGADEFVSTACSPGGSTDSDGDGIPDAVEQIEGTHPCAKDNDVFGSVRLFVMQQYRDFLGREAETDGLLAWMGTIGAGMAPAVVAKTFFDSPEFQGAVAPIARLYFAYFNRVPDQSGLQSWTAQFRAGMSLAAISDVFANSAEFQATYGSLTNGQFVTLVYRNVLGRDPDPGGLAAWVGQLDSGVLTHGQVMLGFSESPEYKQLSYKWVFVTMIYYGMLRRVPDPSGFQSWVAALASGASPLSLIDSFLKAAEYHGRFLP